MTREELKAHALRQVEHCEMWAKHNGEEPNGRVYEEHKLILELLEGERRWIPVSERLPEDRERVIFSTKTDKVFEGKYFDDKTDCKWYAFRDDTFKQNNVVTAWMPLPKPYKPESEVNE